MIKLSLEVVSSIVRYTLVVIVVLIVISSDQLLLLRLICWSDTLGPQVRVISVLLPELSSFELALFIVGHRKVTIEVFHLGLILLRIHLVHILLEQPLYLPLSGIIILPEPIPKVVFLLLVLPGQRSKTLNSSARSRVSSI